MEGHPDCECLHRNYLMEMENSKTCRVFLPLHRAFQRAMWRVHCYQATAASAHSSREWQAQITCFIFFCILNLVCIMELLWICFTVYCVHVSHSIYSPLTTLQGLSWGTVNVTHLCSQPSLPVKNDAYIFLMHNILLSLHLFCSSTPILHNKNEAQQTRVVAIQDSVFTWLSRTAGHLGLASLYAVSIKNITATENREQIQCKSRRKRDNIKHRLTLFLLHETSIVASEVWSMSTPYLYKKQERLDPKADIVSREVWENDLLKIRYPKQARVKTRVSVQKLNQKGLRQKSKKQKLSTQRAEGKKTHTQPPEDKVGHKQT